MVSHAVPGVVGIQNLHRHLGLLQQLPMNMGIRYSAFNGLLGTSFSKKLLETNFQHIQKIRSQAPHIHGYQRIHINNHTVCLYSGCGLHNILSFHSHPSCRYQELHHRYQTACSSTQSQPCWNCLHSTNTHGRL